MILNIDSLLCPTTLHSLIIISSKHTQSKKEINYQHFLKIKIKKEGLFSFPLLKCHRFFFLSFSVYSSPASIKSLPAIISVFPLDFQCHKRWVNIGRREKRRNCLRFSIDKSLFGNIYIEISAQKITSHNYLNK